MEYHSGVEEYKSDQHWKMKTFAVCGVLTVVYGVYIFCEPHALLSKSENIITYYYILNQITIA
jgi:hypothetical protein